VVTGGGSGIGRALAVELARRELCVIVVGRRADALAQTCAAAAAGRITACPADVSTAEGRLAVVEACARAGPVAALVHNAALLHVERLTDMSPSDWDKAMSVNVSAPLFLTKELLPSMHDGSRVLHISSGAAAVAFAGMASYCVSKAALLQLSRAWRADRDHAAGGGTFGPRVLFGSARPGIVDTPMQTQGREADGAVFGSRDTFVAWKAKADEAGAACGDAAGSAWRRPPDGALDTASNAARFLAWLLLDVGGEAFEATEDWDPRTAEPPAEA